MAETQDAAFAAAFARLNELEDKPIPVDFGKTDDAPTAPVAEAPKEPETALETAPETAETPVAEAAPEAPVEPEKSVVEAQKAPEQPQISDDELLKRFASLVRQPPSQPEPQPQAAPPPAPPPLISEDERKFLEAYEKDWPDVAKAEAIRRRADLQSVVGYVFQEIAKEFGPVIQGYRQLAERQQVSDLRSYAPDYDQVRDQVIGWVDTQPAFMKPALYNVIQNGTFQEVTALMDMWRQSTQAASAPSAASQAAPAPKPVTQITDAAKKAAAALAPVSTKRSGATRLTPDNFEDAFAEFAKAI